MAGCFSSTNTVGVTEARTADIEFTAILADACKMYF